VSAISCGGVMEVDVRMDGMRRERVSTQRRKKERKEKLLTFIKTFKHIYLQLATISQFSHQFIT